MSDYSVDYRIGTSAVNMIRLTELGIPLPDDWDYKPYSEEYRRPDGLVTGDGWPSAMWIWSEDNIGQSQIDQFLDFFALDADASVTVYIRTPISRGRGDKVNTDDFQVVMKRPIHGEDKQSVIRAAGMVWEGFTLHFTRLVAT